MNLYQEVTLSFKKVGDPCSKCYLNQLEHFLVSFTWKNVFALGLLHIWLVEGVAKILCCAKRVFMLFTISPIA